MSKTKGHYLIAYDITDPRRLQKVHRYLSGRATWLQYSVFVAALDRDGLNRVVAGLGDLIDPRQDDIRLYPIPPNPEMIWLGRRWLPDGILGFGSIATLPELRVPVGERSADGDPPDENDDRGDDGDEADDDDAS